METKVCKVCQIPKELKEFPAKRHVCRTCHNTKNSKLSKQWRQLNKSKVNTYSNVNKKKSTYREQNNAYRRNRYATDEYYRSKLLLRALVSRLYKVKRKSAKTFELLGYNTEDFVRYFKDELFIYKMYGIDIHIDHKIPVDWFVLDTPASVVNNLENLMPRPAEENLLKSSNYADPVPFTFYQMAIDYIKSEYRRHIKSERDVV